MASPLSYFDSGTGPAIVLLHGFCESKDLWKDFEEHLLLQYRVIVPDLPGHGDTQIPAGDITSVEYMADKVYELLQELNIRECVMIGHSLGGYVTLAFAERYPQMLKAFGLFHSTAFADPEEKKKARNRTIEFIEKHGMNAFADSFVSPLFYVKNREKLKTEIQSMQQICKNTDQNGVKATIAAMRDRKERIEVLSNAKVPVLFIIGKEDTAVALEKSMEQCHLPEKHEVKILDATGHMGMFERKEEAIKAVESFLEKVYCRSERV
jgi:pimeloyl-ACP methyl ester carboxylesterase